MFIPGHRTIGGRHADRPVDAASGASSARVGDFVIERISQRGVRRILGYPGDGIDGLTGAPATVAAIVRPTCGIFVSGSPGHLRRRFDSAVGSALIDPR